MTVASSAPTTQSTPQLNPVTTSSLASPIINGSLSDTNLPDDEPYTIKCICNFQDDDGNTVFCEKCETWQHIECYYHGKKVPEVHNCADCEPRPLDAKRATERQRRLREQMDGGDRKTKRASSKSHKKKVVKDTESLNGWHSQDRQDPVYGSRDQPPPAKRPKTSHRPSGSMTSMNGIPVLTPDSRKRAHSTTQSYPSPTKSPFSDNGVVLPQYTSEFLQLYDDDPGKGNITMRDNFNTLNVTRRLKSWLQDPLALSQDANGRHYHEIFIESDAPLATMSFPPVSLHDLSSSDVEVDGKHPSWKLLKIDTDVHRDDIVGEIKGSVGLLSDYCLDEANRWKELRHPEPFVFFHPQLPIYIDCRREGTKFRYLRRSCRPNVTMKTYIDSGGEYHYCFVAKEDLHAGTELTASWYLDQAVLNRGSIKEESSSNREYELPAPEVWASRVLANFGDCACDSIQPCMLAPLDRRRTSRMFEGTAVKQTNGRRKKAAKSKHMSPPVASRRSASRAGSEMKAMDDDELVDNRSTSGSVRSRPRSRDMTPTNVADSAPGDGLTDRERRKIAAAEKTFERLEQDRQEKKKKKRSSGGSVLNTPNVNTSKQLSGAGYSQPSSPMVGHRAFYVDANTSSRRSNSPPALSTDLRKSANPGKSSTPSTSSFLSLLRRPTYVDSAVQTEESSVVESPPVNRRRFTTMTQRLLKRCHEDRLKYEEMEHRRLSFSVANTLPSPVSEGSAPLPSIQGEQSLHDDDADMRDVAPPALSSSPMSASFLNATKPAVFVDGSLFSPPPLPSQAAHTRKALPPPNGQRLQLSGLPPIPSFDPTNSGGTPSSQATSPFAPIPLTAYTGSQVPGQITPSANPSITAPSPIKKKLSLGDYMSRRNATPVVEKTQAQASNPIALGLSEGDSLAGIDNKEAASKDPTPLDVISRANENANLANASSIVGANVSDTPGVDVPMKEAADVFVRLPIQPPDATAVLDSEPSTVSEPVQSVLPSTDVQMKRESPTQVSVSGGV